MENASLAVRMAGGVLIALLIIGFFISIMVVINDNKQKEQDEEDLKQVVQFNESYKSFENRIITGYQMLSLINKAIDYNQRMSRENEYSEETYTPIHIFTQLADESEGGSKMLPNQKNANKYRNEHKDKYIDLNEYYAGSYVSATTEQKNEFKNMYFKWVDTKHVQPDAEDLEGKRLGNVDGIGKVYEMYFCEYVKK